jgi:hypothetical protein
MSIDKLKKQSKNLLNLLPDFVRDHSSAELRLADCQELVARIHGYPNWHAAAARAGSTPAEATEPRSEPTPAINITLENGKLAARVPGSTLVIESEGDDERTRTALLKHVSKLHEFQERQKSDHEEGVPALKRLFAIAQGDSGQCRFVAAFLLGLYNGMRFPFDLTDFRRVDTAIFDDCIRVLRMDAAPQREVHKYFDDGNAKFEALARDWHISDVWRLKNLCNQVKDRGVISFGGERELAAEIEHAMASTRSSETS